MEKGMSNDGPSMEQRLAALEARVDAAHAAADAAEKRARAAERRVADLDERQIGQLEQIAIRWSHLIA